MNERIVRLRRLRTALIVLAGAIFIVPCLLWLNWPRISLQDPHLSHWESPAGEGTISIYWNHSLRPGAEIYVRPATSTGPLIRFGVFDDDDMRFDATFFWSQDGQVFAAVDMPQWDVTVPEDRNGRDVEAPIYTHAYDFSTSKSIGHADGKGGSATDFLARHAEIETLFSNHGSRGESFTVDDILAMEFRLKTVGWWRWSRRMEEATDPFLEP